MIRCVIQRGRVVCVDALIVSFALTLHSLLRQITKRISDVHLNGDRDARYPGNLNFSFAFVEGESLLMALKNIAVSSGSACTSASLEPSYVLRALGVDDVRHVS